MTDPGERLGTIVGGKYRITKRLGAGGMGVVYEALQIVVKRRFAIKFLRADLALRRDVLGRFQREAEAAGALENENIAAAVDFGIAPDGAPYIVMEYLAGVDLAQLLAASGPLPVERAADLVLQACRGIQEAHAAGVIHRDLKPENLFVCRRNDGSDLVKIVDFGIAKLQASDAGNAVTSTGGMVGTPSYMSPEQARGDATVDPRSDVYSLGAVLYELLCGHVPHPGDSYNAVIYHISTQAALPLKTREGQGFPPELLELVNRALSLRPDDRHESAEALASELAAFARRVVWPKVDERVAPRRDSQPSPDPDAHALPGTSPGSALGAAPRRASAHALRTPAIIASGLAVAVAVLLSIERSPEQKAVPESSLAHALPSPAIASVPSIASERGNPGASTAFPMASAQAEEVAPAKTPVLTRPGRPATTRGRPEARPVSSAAAAEQPTAAVKATASSSGRATFDPRNPYE